MSKPLPKRSYADAKLGLRQQAELSGYQLLLQQLHWALW